MASTPRRSTGSGPRGGARKSATRKTATKAPPQAGPPSLTMAHAKGFLAGAVAGLLVGAGGVTYLSKEGANAPSLPQDVTTKEQSLPQPKFDFYTLLPNQDLDFSEGIEPAELQARRQSDDLYVLQAGSFRARQDADRRRGELALLGLEATIEQTRGENGVWYRVYLGPFDSRSAMAKARSMTAQQSIDTLLLKRPRSP